MGESTLTPEDFGEEDLKWISDLTVRPISTGENNGTCFFVSPSHIVTAAHNIGGNDRFYVGNVPYTRDDVLHVDQPNDLALIHAKQASDFWLVPEGDIRFNRRYLCIARFADHRESVFLTANGTRESPEDGGRLIALNGGQVSRGFSGSPIIDLQSLCAVGMIRKTRDFRKPNDLGGFMAPLSALAPFLQPIRDNGRNLSMLSGLRLRLTGTESSRLAKTRTKLPHNRGAGYGRTGDIAQILNDARLGHQIWITGSPGIGKTTVVTKTLKRVPQERFDGAFYFDVGIYNGVGDEWPILRAITDQFDLGIRTSPFGGTPPETVAAHIRLRISQEMSGCIVALDHFSTTDHTFCSDLNTLEDGPLASACTLIVASPSVFRDDERTDQAQVEIDPLDAVSAALIVSDVTGASSEVALRFAESLEAHMRSPRDLIRVLRNAEVAATVSDEESTAAKEAFRSAYRERFRSAITATPDAERAALVDAVWSYLTDATAAERHRTPADITPILGRAIPGNAKEAIYLSGEDLYETLDDDMLKHRLNDSDFKANLDKLLSTIDRARSTDSASAEPAPANLATIDELIDEVALASRTSTLGPIIVTPPRFASAEGDQTLSRALSRIRSIRNEVRRLDELSDCAVPAKIDLSAYALELVANELCYTDLVHDFPRQVDAYRRRVIDRATRGPAVADTDTAWRIRLDSCESAISRGSVDDVAATWIRELSERSTDRPSSVAGQLQIRAKIHRLIVDGDAEQLGGVWHEVQRVVADMTAVSTPDNEIADLVAKFISASAALDSRSPTLRASVKQFQETMFGDDDDSSSISKYCLSTRAVSITAATLDAHEEKELLEPFLKRAIKHMASVLETLRELAIAGDNRPVLTSARQRRRLSRLLFDRGLMEQARLERDAAISELRWVVDNCPTPAAWLTLLRCVDTEERFALEDTLQLASLRTNDSMNRFAPLRKQYRKWAQSIAGVNMRLVEIEYMLLESTWSREGSILQIANHSDRRWMSRPIDQKLKKLTHLHEQRVLSLDRLQRRFGHSHFSTVMRASVEAQYQTSVALIKRSDFDPLPVDAILNKGLTADPQSLRLKFERARHLRSRRQFAEARMQLDASETNLSIADPLLARAWRVLYADVLLQLAAMAEPDERIRLATEAVGIVDQYADGDIRAAMILGRAHAEAGYAPRVSMISVVQLLVQANEFAEFVDNFRDRVTEFDSLALRVGDKATAQLVTDVTNPEALFGYALVLIRHFIRSDRSEATLNFLKAAMLCLDGARVMTSGRAMTPVVNFLIGLSAIMACRITGLADPLGCSKGPGARIGDRVSHAA